MKMARWVNTSPTSSEPEARAIFSPLCPLAAALVLLCSAISADAQQPSRPNPPLPLLTCLEQIRLADAANAILALRSGSLLQLTGVCTTAVDANREPRGFQVLLRSASDIVALHLASWWTAPHSLWTLGLMGAIFLLTLGWAGALRCRVNDQTGVLVHRVQRIAVLEERYRLLLPARAEVVAGPLHPLSLPNPTPLVELLSTRTASPVNRGSLNILLVEDNAVNQL